MLTSTRHFTSAKTQIANVGFNDVTRTAVGRAVSQDTLFIHGSSDGGGSTTNHAVLRSNDRGPILPSDCTSACGSADTYGVSGMSTVCDSSCRPEWSSAGPRFNGHGCGASDPSRFGKTCRQCYTSQETALAEERRLSSPEFIGSNPGVHVVMCSTGTPPQAADCSDECFRAADAVRWRSSGLFQCDAVRSSRVAWILPSPIFTGSRHIQRPFICEFRVLVVICFFFFSYVFCLRLKIYFEVLVAGTGLIHLNKPVVACLLRENCELKCPRKSEPMLSQCVYSDSFCFA